MLFGQTSSMEKVNKKCLYDKKKKDMRKSAVWIDCWANGSDAHFHTQHVTLQIRGSVSCKRLLTRQPVSSQHNTDSFKSTGVPYQHDETLWLQYAASARLSPICIFNVFCYISGYVQVFSAACVFVQHLSLNLMRG